MTVREGVGNVGLFFLLLLFSLVGNPSTALAHEHPKYWFETWPSGDVKYDMTVGVPDGLGSVKHDVIAEGGRKWNDLTNFITFKRSGDEVSDFNPNTQTCSKPPAIHWINHSTGLAYTLWCQNFIGTVLDGFQIVFDEDPAAVSWYWGINPPQGPNTFSVDGTSGHEFGHAAGGWIEGVGEQGHFDIPNNPNLCGSSVPLLDLHTMCTGQNWVDRFVGNSYMNSLELHDRHTFEYWYP